MLHAQFPSVLQYSRAIADSIALTDASALFSPKPIAQAPVGLPPVVQKSIVEGFGLTVTEPMWKGRCVIASRVGGIQDQIEHGENGLLLDDPHDLDGFAALLAEVLDDEDRCHRMGKAARESVRERFLGDLALIRYAELVRDLVG